MDSNYHEEFSSVSNPEDNGHAQFTTCLEIKVKVLSAHLEALAGVSDMEEMLAFLMDQAGRHLQSSKIQFKGMSTISPKCKNFSSLGAVLLNSRTLLRSPERSP
jgi:hypothetical protein